MLETIRNAFKTKEIRNKLLFVFMGLIIVRIGCNIPIPGVNTSVIQNLFNFSGLPRQSYDCLGFLQVGLFCSH